VARAHFLITGMKHDYGSLNEAIAIHTFTRQRNIDFMAAVFAVVDPTSTRKAVNLFRGAMFPEERNNDLEYIKKAQELMVKARELTIIIRPKKLGRYGD